MIHSWEKKRMYSGNKQSWYTDWGGTLLTVNGRIDKASCLEFPTNFHLIPSNPIIPNVKSTMYTEVSTMGG